MTSEQKVLEALLNAAGQDVAVSRLLEITRVINVRPYIARLRKAGFLIHTHVESSKGGPGTYRLELGAEGPSRALALISQPHRKKKQADAVTEQFGYGTNGTNPTRVLRAEIAQRRKENRGKYRERGWYPDPLLIFQQNQLLDWIEAQLEAMDPDPIN